MIKGYHVCEMYIGHHKLSYCCVLQYTDRNKSKFKGECGAQGFNARKHRVIKRRGEAWLRCTQPPY